MTLSSAATPTHLIGHDEAMRQVTDAFASGRMHHAWLLAGTDGIGKATLATHIANHVLSSGQNPLGRIDLQHRITKLILAEAHPDMLVIRRPMDDKTGELKNIIPVEEALKVASFLRKTSTHGGWRVVIIDEAHTLNRHGQNAILKILEEPPTQALILMTATTPGALLPTIRSRSRVLHMAPLDETQMRSILKGAAPELAAIDLTRLIALSNGSIGFALKIMRTETLPLYDQLLEILRQKPDPDITRLHALADQVSRKADAESFDVLTTLLLNHLRGSITREARKQGSHPTLGNQLRALDEVQNIFNIADHGNLDKKLTFVKAVTDMARA